MIVPEVTWEMLFYRVEGKRGAFGGAEVLAAALEELEKELVCLGDGREGAGVVWDQDAVELSMIVVIDVGGDLGESIPGLLSSADIFYDVGEVGLFVFLGPAFHKSEVEVSMIGGVALNLA